MEFPNYCVTFYCRNGWWENEKYFYHTKDEAIDHMNLFVNDKVAEDLYEKITVTNDETEEVIAELEF